jgi:hypothetical protein
MEVMRCKLLKVFHIELSHIGAIHHQNCPTTLNEIFQAEFKKNLSPLFNPLILGHRLNHKCDLLVNVRHFLLLVAYT